MKMQIQDYQCNTLTFKFRKYVFIVKMPPSGWIFFIIFLEWASNALSFPFFYIGVAHHCKHLSRGPSHCIQQRAHGRSISTEQQPSRILTKSFSWADPLARNNRHKCLTKKYCPSVNSNLRPAGTIIAMPLS